MTDITDLQKGMIIGTRLIKDFVPKIAVVMSMERGTVSKIMGDI